MYYQLNRKITPLDAINKQSLSLWVHGGVNFKFSNDNKICFGIETTYGQGARAPGCTCRTVGIQVAVHAATRSPRSLKACCEACPIRLIASRVGISVGCKAGFIFKELYLLVAACARDSHLW